MLDGLFSEDDCVSTRHIEPSKFSIHSPPRPRYQCGLAGISNQGATCYLNSLLQTLLLTPEFRESLFALGKQDLGRLENKDRPGEKVRIIPLQLQRLFARLLLSNQQSISTTELTDSFGWNNNEELQQHDVQELNRILFSAIEASLVGTPGKDLINRLYHGTVVNQIICYECGQISEREEDFLDLTVTVAGNNCLDQGLYSSFIDMESLDGKNQYKCDRCKKLVNAKKGAKIRSLPEILTISLLRFSFDLQKLERYKETGKLVFPHLLDMGPYCEQAPESTEYELFSVVIHKGGAYGGHYHAFIRDVDSLGNWTHPDEEPIQLPTDPRTGEVDYIEVDSPVELIQAILVRNTVLNIDKLCAEINKQTGVSWNKRFRKTHGSIVKFLERNNDVFTFDPASNQVTLGSSASQSNKIQETVAAPNSSNQTKNKRPVSPNPLKGHAWFNFDDSRVSPIRVNEIEKQFQGKESAYMLFYRKRTLSAVEEAAGNPAYKVPDSLVTEIIIENDELQRKREEFEVEMNRVAIQIHFSQSYQYFSGALQPMLDQCGWMELNIDRRKTIADLKIAVQELGELVPEVFVLQRMRELPAGFHLYDFVSGDDTKQIRDLCIDNGTMLFVWNGCQVNGDTVHFGRDKEPILLNISYGIDGRCVRGFAKCLTLEEFKVMVSEQTGISVKNLRLKRMVGQDTNPKLVDFTNDLLDTTLEALKLKDGDEVLVENKQEATSSCKVLQNKLTTFPVYIENRCTEILSDENRRIRLDVKSEMLVGEIKTMAISKFCVHNLIDGGRLRIDHETLGLRSPLYESHTINEANISKGSNLVLEPGPAPSTNQITLTFTPGDPSGNLSDIEVTLDKMNTVDQCLQCMILKAGFSDDDWHLQKTNWCGEAAEVLDNLDLTLEMSLVNHGDHLLLVRGKLPPKGFVRIPIILYPSPRQPFSDSNNTSGGGVFGWFTSQFTGLLNIGNKPKETSSVSEEPVYLGEIEVALVMTLEEFKFQILTLPAFSGVSLPTSGFLRVRMVDPSGCLSTVLKGPSQTLQKLKLKSCNKLAVQILDEEENLNVNQIVLCIKQRIPTTKEYLPPVEVIWDTSQGPSVQSLQKLISERLFIPLEHLGMAKHFPKRFEWMVIRENYNKSGKGKKKGQKTNLRHGPYNLQDGDIIGIKNLELEVERKDDYSTEEDEIGKQELQRQTEIKKKEREERKKYQDALDIPNSRRPEVALSIKVEDFR